MKLMLKGEKHQKYCCIRKNCGEIDIERKINIDIDIDIVEKNKKALQKSPSDMLFW